LVFRSRDGPDDARAARSGLVYRRTRWLLLRRPGLPCGDRTQRTTGIRLHWAGARRCAAHAEPPGACGFVAGLLPLAPALAGELAAAVELYAVWAVADRAGDRAARSVQLAAIRQC